MWCTITSRAQEPFSASDSGSDSVSVSLSPSWTRVCLVLKLIATATPLRNNIPVSHSPFPSFFVPSVSLLWSFTCFQIVSVEFVISYCSAAHYSEWAALFDFAHCFLINQLHSLEKKGKWRSSDVWFSFLSLYLESFFFF